MRDCCMTKIYSYRTLTIYNPPTREGKDLVSIGGSLVCFLENIKLMSTFVIHIGGWGSWGDRSTISGQAVCYCSREK